MDDQVYILCFVVCHLFNSRVQECKALLFLFYVFHTGIIALNLVLFIQKTFIWQSILPFRFLRFWLFSTFKIHTFKVWKWSEPHSMDFLGNQHHANWNCTVLVAWGIHATGFTLFSHFKSVNFESANTLSKCESKAMLQ